MRVWDVEVLRKAGKSLLKLPADIQEIADKAIKALEFRGPVPEYWDVKKTGDNEYRIRLNYRYRMRYSVTPKEILIEVFYIGHRKDAYRT